MQTPKHPVRSRVRVNIHRYREPGSYRSMRRVTVSISSSRRPPMPNAANTNLGRERRTSVHHSTLLGIAMPTIVVMIILRLLQQSCTFLGTRLEGGHVRLRASVGEQIASADMFASQEVVQQARKQIANSVMKHMAWIWTLRSGFVLLLDRRLSSENSVWIMALSTRRRAQRVQWKTGLLWLEILSRSRVWLW